MAISLVNPPKDVPPVLLHLWQEAMLESVWHFNQIVGDDAPLNEPCPVYVQPNRDMLARGLYGAYARVRNGLSYDPIPMWHSEKVRFGGGSPWVFQSLRLKWLKIKAFGTRATTLIQAGAVVTYSKSDPALTVNDLATISVTLPAGVTNADEVQVFFRVADGAPFTADARWQIVPLDVSISGGNATITGHRSLFVQPSIWKTPFIGINQVTRNEAVTSDASDFVTLVDVYRVYPDATSAVTLQSDPLSAWCCNAQSTPGVTATQAGVGWIEQEDESLFRVRLDPAACLNVYPQMVHVNYVAGEDWQYGQMDNDLAKAIVHLANTYLPQVPCEVCNQANASFQEDVNVKIQRAGKGGAYVESDPSPFGTQVGAHRAWQIVKDRRITRGGKMTSRG